MARDPDIDSLSELGVFAATNAATSNFVPNPLHFVPAPSSCDVSFGIPESTFPTKLGSVRGVKSSRRGRSFAAHKSG